MASFKQFVKDYLNFTTREKMGIAGLLSLIALFYFLPDLLFKDKDYSKELKAFEKELAAMDSGNSEEPNYEYTNNDYQSSDLYEPFYFDPNTVNPMDLEKFGVPKYVIERFEKYRNAGARFYKKEDLKKLYGLKAHLYQRMAPYIQIGIVPPQFKSKTEKQSEFKKIEPQIIELNSADSFSLVKVKGIGPYLSSKILNYRNALGGFVAVNQLYEIFNIKPEQVDAIKPFITINSSSIKRINVNSADYFRLNGHPYISSKAANAIINYRKQHGPYNSIVDLEKVFLLSKETLVKMAPYLEY
ncbi:MAG: helix-hairpin-helix domain-containing protein [Bacteroidia bacterium]